MPKITLTLGETVTIVVGDREFSIDAGAEDHTHLVVRDLSDTTPLIFEELSYEFLAGIETHDEDEDCDSPHKAAFMTMVALLPPATDGLPECANCRNGNETPKNETPHYTCADCGRDSVLPF